MAWSFEGKGCPLVASLFTKEVGFESLMVWVFEEKGEEYKKAIAAEKATEINGIDDELRQDITVDQAG